MSEWLIPWCFIDIDCAMATAILNENLNYAWRIEIKVLESASKLLMKNSSNKHNTTLQQADFKILKT